MITPYKSIDKVKIVYLYNKDNWALHNVGKLWFSNTPEEFSVDIVNYHSIEDSMYEFCAEYDYVWFGYLYMYMKFNYAPTRTIVSVHDPMELFPQRPDWKNSKPLKQNLGALRLLTHITTVSSELKNMLSALGIPATFLPTTTWLPFRAESEISKAKKLSVVSIADDRPRKNIDLLKQVAEHAKTIGVESTVKIGGTILSDAVYKNMLDTANTYICTSYQEGGPLPIMDAMARGCAILTTPVGQAQELIEDGLNGFICTNEWQFIEKISFLNQNPEALQKMRVKALETIQNKRKLASITDKVNHFLRDLPKV